MTLQNVLEKTTKFFKDKGIDSARLDAELLLLKGLGLKKRVDLYLKFDQPLKEQEISLCRELVMRRSQGEPVAYILGEKDFYNSTFLVSPAVLIPRPETEILVEEVLNWIGDKVDLNLIDLGTGSGCIALTLAKKIPSLQVTCVDASPDAIAIAKKNSENLDLQNQSTFFIKSVSSLNYPENQFDIVVSNPPYIAENDPNVQLDVKRFEPHLALYAPEQGLKYLKEWSSQFAKTLRPRAIMAFEMGATQAQEMKKHFENLKTFDEIKIVKDLAGFDRHIIGIKKGS